MQDKIVDRYRKYNCRFVDCSRDRFSAEQVLRNMRLNELSVQVLSIMIIIMRVL